jgi:pyruvate/2-oxoglutarate dehydrogenase complex dihydrolipoamide dehydrogenase (E3) component
MISPTSAVDSAEFDVVILGGGAGAKVIWGSVDQRAIAVVEQSRVGGVCPSVWVESIRDG